MKITNSDYATMVEKIREALRPIPYERIRNVKLAHTEKAFVWEVWYGADPKMEFTTGVLYKYLNDDHITTALRRACQEVLTSRTDANSIKGK